MIQRDGAPVGIIGAMKSEMDRIKAKVTNPRMTRISDIDFVEGEICGVPVVVATSGMGKVFAALCAQTMILKFAPGMIINVGVAGSLSKDLNIGDIAVAESVVHHDLDSSGLGDPPGLISGLNMIWLPCDEEVIRGLSASAGRLGFHYRRGVIATGDIFVQDAARKRKIADTFQAVACEMEGAGVGHVCYVNHLPFCVLRAISDNGDEAATNDYQMSLDMAAERASQVMEDYLRSLSGGFGSDQGKA